MSSVRTFFAAHARDFVYWVKKLWWVFVIVFPCFFLGTFLAVDHANANQDRTQARANEQFRRSLIVTDRKFREALHVQTRLFAYSTNKSVCTLRPFLQAARQARLAAAKNATTEAERKPNLKAARTYEKLIDSQVTVPSTFKCSTLPEKPPKGTP